MNKRTFSAVASLILSASGLLALSGCSAYNLERKLSPKYSDFYDRVSYIITKEERATFLKLPDSEKDAFINEFWKKRDPEPATEVNEFRMEYEKRLAQSTRLFGGEGRDGWRTDRGRIYILFGPPTERQTYNVDSSGYCREIWYYGTFPVIFVDRGCIGRYDLTPINLEHLNDLNMAQNNFRAMPSQRLSDKKVLDYDLVLADVKSDETKLEGKLRISIRYSAIGFDFKNNRLETSFEVRAAAYGHNKKRVWEAAGTYPLSLTSEELMAASEKLFVIELPLVITADKDDPAWSEVTIETSVRNAIEKSEQIKSLKVKPRS